MNANHHARKTTFLRYLLNKRTSAGALQLTVGISVVIAALCSMMILLGYYARISSLQSDIKSALADNAVSGINYLMANRTQVDFNEKTSIDLFNEGIDSVSLVRK